MAALVDRKYVGLIGSCNEMAELQRSMRWRRNVEIGRDKVSLLHVFRHWRETREGKEAWTSVMIALHCG